RGWLFGVTCHDTRGAIALATAAWANLFSRCAAIRTSTSGLTLVSAAKMSKLQGEAPAPPWHRSKFIRLHVDGARRKDSPSALRTPVCHRVHALPHDPWTCGVNIGYVMAGPMFLAPIVNKFA